MTILTKLARKVSKRGVSDFDKIRGALEGRKENAIANPDARRAGLSKNVTQHTCVGGERIGVSQARTKGGRTGGGQGAWNAGVAREKPSFGGAWKYDGLLAGYDRLYLVMHFVPGRAHVVAQSVVKCEIRFYPPTVLRKQSEIKTPAAGRKGQPLDKGAGRTQKKIDEVAACLGSPAVHCRAEEKEAICGVGEILFELIGVVLASKFQGVRADDFAEVVSHLVAVLGDANRFAWRSEEHTSELQSHLNLVCRLLLEKKNKSRTGSCKLGPICEGACLGAVPR